MLKEYSDVFWDVFRKAFDSKTGEKLKDCLGQSTTYFITEIRPFLQTFVVLKLFLPVDQFEGGGLLLALRTVLKPGNKVAAV